MTAHLFATRYVVLADLDSPDVAPCGLVVDRGDHVQVVLPEGWGLRTRYSEPIDGELEPDGTWRTYTPADREFFERVVYSCSRSFVILDPADHMARGDA